MRRTLVSRKARKRRIAENAEMSGENYYNRQNAAAAALNDAKTDSVNGDAKEAYVTGSPTADGPTFATFRTNTRESDDDRTPLNSRTPANDYPLPEQPPRNGMPYSAARDEVGNPLPPSGPYAAAGRGGRPYPGDSRMNGPGGPLPPGFGARGRGGYPPRGGYGRGGPYGAPRGRGSPMGPMRGGPPGMRGRGGYRGPPPVDYGYDAYGAGPVPRTHPTPPPAEYRGTSPVYRQPSPGRIGMALSPDAGPVGQAIEMTPQPRRSPGPEHDPQPHALSVDGYPEPTSPSSFYSRTP